MSSDSAHRLIQYKRNSCRLHTYEDEAENIYKNKFHQSTTDLRLSWRVRIVSEDGQRCGKDRQKKIKKKH